MAEYGIRCLHLTSEKEALDALKQAEVDPHDIQAMLPKMLHLNVIIDSLECPAANRIKQEMLSLGGDAATARGAAECSVTRTDVILMGTLLQMQRFAVKVSAQPFGFGGISERLLEILGTLLADSFPLQTSRRKIILGERTLIMGIINVTPDSFSDGGRFDSPEKAVEEGIRMAEEGADILDIGGESTRPGSDPVSPEEEMRRLIPVIRALASRTDLPLSVDTMKASVARKALEEGAEIINDVSAMEYDKAMLKVVADAGAAVVLMHMRGTPKSMQAGDLAYHSLRGEIIAYLRERIERVGDMGIDPTQIMVDPGLGFGKSADDNLRLIRYLREFRVLGRPVLIGASRKAFIGRVTGGAPAERDGGTAAAVTAAILNGSHVIRVHNVPMMKKVAAVADAVLRA
jgi:dihydropteroate synthase